MKKLIITILALTIASIANAEYSIKINLDDEPIKFTNWQEYDSIYGDWTNSNSLYGCTNWTPSPDEVTINLEYTQTATDCSQDQTRTVQDQTIDTVSNQVVNDGDLYAESRTITVSDSRQAVGTMETWVATIPLYITDWTNNGGIYGCNTWSPSPSTVTINQSFTQTSNDCEQDQERVRQDREQETTTNEIRNTGSPITESRTIAATSTRNATGTKIVKQCLYQSSVYYAQVNVLSTWKWNGVTVGTTGSTVNTLVASGFKYTMGAFKSSAYDSNTKVNTSWFEICREPL